jgi:hypothetical protein
MRRTGYTVVVGPRALGRELSASAADSTSSSSSRLEINEGYV